MLNTPSIATPEPAAAERPFLSLVIPAYNEEARIGDTLARAHDYLARQSYTAEIIVVDDGSTDATIQAARAKYDNMLAVRVVSLGQNLGKGAAVRAGMLEHALGAYRVFYDADGATPIEELSLLWPHFEAGADIVIGSRALATSQVLVHQRWYRERLGRINNTILRALGITAFRDTQCGFKAFTAHACKEVFPRQTVDRFSFDAELLYIAKKHALRIDEVPVRWVNSPASRLNPLTDAPRMLWDLLTIRWKDLRGAYE